MRPILSVIIPTIGRPTLDPLLLALRRQMPAAEVEILVVGDTHRDTWAAPLAAVPALCDRYAARYLRHDGGVHAWGHPQRTYGATAAHGAWLWWLQDDDLPTPEAWGRLRQRLVGGPCLPHLFQTQTWQAGVVWHAPELRLCNIDADCLVAPNVPKRLAPWPPRYNGDFEMITETVAHYSGACEWVDAVIAVGRPAGVPADVRKPPRVRV